MGQRIVDFQWAVKAAMRMQQVADAEAAFDAIGGKDVRLTHSHYA